VTTFLLIVAAFVVGYWIGWDDRRLGEQDDANMRGLDQLKRSLESRP